MVPLQAFLSFLPRAPKFPVPLFINYSPLRLATVPFLRPLCLMRQDQRFCAFTRNWSLFVVFATGTRTVKMFYFARSGKQSNSVWTMLGSAPIYLWLVMYLQFSWSDKYGNWWAEYKTLALTAGSSFPFPLRAFLFPWALNLRELGNDLFTTLPNHPAEFRDIITYS